MATANASPASVPATRRAEAIGHVCSTARRAANAESQSNLRIAISLPYAPARVSYVFSRLWCVVNQPEVLDGAFWTDTLVLIVSQRLAGCRLGKSELWNGLWGQMRNYLPRQGPLSRFLSKSLRGPGSAERRLCIVRAQSSYRSPPRAATRLIIRSPRRRAAESTGVWQDRAPWRS